MATIYVWPSKLTNGLPGHASLKLHKSGIYISHWPKSNNKSWTFGLTKAINQTAFKPYYVIADLKDDLNLEKSYQPIKIHIDSHKINEDKVADWWRRFQGTYHLIKKNCCDVVMDALEAGGAYEWVVPWPALLRTPYGVSVYGRRLASATEKGGGYDSWYVLKMARNDGLREVLGL